MMTHLFVFLSRLRAWLAPRRLDDDFDQELQEHLSLLIEENIRRGMPPEEAARAARIRLGGAAQLKETHRELRGLPILETLTQDVRYALRILSRSPMFTCVAIVTLAIGIGVNTTVFSLYNAVALKRLPVRDAETVFRVERWFATGARGNIQYLFSYPDYVYYRAHSRALSSVVAASWPIRVASEQKSLEGQLVSENYFSEFGVNAIVGRTLQPDDNRTPGAHPVIVLSHPFWQTRFNGDSRVVGSAFRLNDTLFTIVGVAPPDFIGTGNPPQIPDFWAPVMMQAALDPSSEWLHQEHVSRLELLARLSPGTTAAQAEAELTLLAAQRPPDPAGEKTVAMTIEHATLFGETNDPRFRAFVGLVMAVVAMVLLTACGNLANMLLARATGRQREIGVRFALGASRARVVQQLLVESLVLGLLGGSAGLALSTWSCKWLWVASVDAIQGFVNAGVPPVIRLDPDARVFTYTVLMSIAAALLFGLSPALQFSKPDLTAALKGLGGGVAHQISRSRLRQILVGCQVTISIAMLISAGLLTRGVVRSQATDPGFETKRVFVVGFDRGTDRQRGVLLQRRVFEAVRSLPGVRSAGFVLQVPLRNTWATPMDVGGSFVTTLANRVSPEYFETLDIPFERGRNFIPDEIERSASVSIVSESTARRLWPDSDPIGKRVKLDAGFGTRGQFAEFEVVGVVKDVRSANLSRMDPSYVYLPTEPSRNYTLLIQTQGDPRAALSSVRASIRAIDRNLTRSLQMLSLEEGPLRFQRLLPQALAVSAAVLASLALALAAVGIYGVVSYLVSQQIQEIGVRMALGATTRDILWMVVGQGLRPVFVGMAVGVLGAAAVSSFLHAVLLLGPAMPDLTSGVGAFDPVTFGGLSMLVAAIAALASYIPAHRAAKVDPLVALRYE